MNSLIHRVKSPTFVMFVLAILAGGALLHVSQMVQDAEDRLHYLESKIEAEHESIRVLKAEWAYLNSPQRLEALSSAYLDLRAPTSKQILAGAQALPEIPVISMPQGALYQEVSLSPLNRSALPVAREGEEEITSRIFVPGRKPDILKEGFGDLLDRAYPSPSLGIEEGGAP